MTEPTIWKFVLSVDRDQTVHMPHGARLLSVANQIEAPCLWALVDPDAPLVPRALLMVGTGHVANSAMPFIGTALMEGGMLVLHVFDGGEQPS